MRTAKRRLVCSFGGGGGGAKGFQESQAELYGQTSEFELVGSFDNEPYACAAFEYLTGVVQTCIDAREMTPVLMREFYGASPPFAFFGSPPCVGYSKLLSTAKSKTARYTLFNELALVNTQLILDTWADDLPAFLLYENVPNIKARGKAMLAKLGAMLKAAGYILQDGFHECRTTGDLAQRRKRWFLVARHPKKVPAFLYLPPHKKGKVCADVLDELPMPNDPAGGPMHVMPAISALNWWRLWAIPAGGDWRDLLPDDGTPRRARFRRHHLEKWTEPSVTIGGSGSNGPCGIADPRERFHHVDKVTGWHEAAGTVTHSPAPSSGAIAIADPRFKGSLGVLDPHEPSGTVTSEAYPSTGRFAIADERSLLAMDLGAQAHLNLYRVTPLDEPANTVTGATRPGNGAISIADDLNRHHNVLGVLRRDGPSGTVTGQGKPTSGAFSYAAPVPLALQPQAGNARMHHDKYAVRPWDGVALTVHGATRVGSGAPSVAQPLAAKGFPGAWGVLDPHEASGAVTGNARISTGAYNIAAPVPFPINLVPNEKCYDRGYAVIDRAAQPSNTIAGTSAVGCGTYAITDVVPAPLDLALKCSPRAGAYGVIDEVSPTVIGSASIDNSASAIAAPTPRAPAFVVLSYEQALRVANGEVTAPFAIVDVARPDVALAIVDDMSKPPYRWEESVGKRGKVTRTKVKVPIVLVSKDGTWHRPLTTLELGVLQGLTWRHAGRPLDFGGGSTEQRELIGNMVPRPVGKAMGTQMLLAGIASDQGLSFMYGGGGSGVWVTPAQRARLLMAGVRCIQPRDIDKMGAEEVVILDDCARRIRRRPGHSHRATSVAAARLLERLLRDQSGTRQPTHEGALH